VQPRSSSAQLPRLNWDDLRLVLTLARCGSLNAAAAELSVNVSTASRRLNQVEAALGVLCFVRRPSGIEPTTAGRMVIDHAEEIERQTVRLKRATAIDQASPASTVTITSPDSVSTAIILPALAERSNGNAAAPVNLITDNRVLDLHRGEADLALRLRRPANGGLRIRKIAELAYGFFASEAYLAQHGPLRCEADLARHLLVGMSSTYPNHATAVWWEEVCGRARVLIRTDRALDRQVAAEQGFGITMLPVALGERSRLKRILTEVTPPGLEVFLLAEPGALRVREVRDVADRIASYARRHSAALH